MFYVYMLHFGIITFAFYPEAVVRRCSLKSYFLKLSQNSQENTCAGVSFQAPLATSLKQRLQHRRFPVNFCEISKIITFNSPPPLAAFFPSQDAKHKKYTKTVTCNRLFV